MSDRTTRFRQAVAVPQGLMQGMTEIARDAAKQNDAGTLGVDGWIRAGHQMIDLWARVYAGFLQAIIAGPWWAAPPPSGEPLPSDPKTVPAQPYPRKFTIVKPFARVGLPQIRIPNQFIRFEPEQLAAGQTQFRIALRNYNFVGANYTGTLRLSPTATTPGTRSENPITVIVGL
jgi:hypothetical protein